MNELWSERFNQTPRRQKTWSRILEVSGTEEASTPSKQKECKSLAIIIGVMYGGERKPS